MDRSWNGFRADPLPEERIAGKEQGFAHAAALPAARPSGKVAA
jgi:hypothetical protein